MAPESINNNGRINVAIIGGGIVGLCTAIGLNKYPHINVQVYESAPDFGEIGAGIALGANSLRALRLIDPQLEEMCLSITTRNGDKDNLDTWFVSYLGEHQDGRDEPLKLGAIKSDLGQMTFHRAKLLYQLVSRVPKEICHFGKRLKALHEGPDGLVSLEFRDGTGAEANCVLAADGVHSTVRKLLLGEDPSINPKFSGIVAFRGLVPIQKLCDAVRTEKGLNPAHYYANDCMVTTMPIDGGDVANMVALDHTSYKSWNGPWTQPISFSEMQQKFAHLDGTCQKIIQLFDLPDLMAWSLWDLPPLPTFCKSRVALIGDSAHASTPYHGQGAGQGMEDAAVLERLLGYVQDSLHIPSALCAYDAIRRPSAQRQTRLSLESAHMYTDLSNMADYQSFRKFIEKRMHSFWDRDIEEQIEQAKIAFDHLVEAHEPVGKVAVE